MPGHKLARGGVINRGSGRRADRVGSRYNHKLPTVSPLNWNSSQRTRGWWCDAYIVLWLHGRTRGRLDPWHSSPAMYA
jgi:hypothetical protein